MKNEPTRLPKIEVIAPNVTKVYLPGGLVLFYSYEEVVGFRATDGERVFSSEFHSKTSSRHLSDHYESEKKERVDPEIFAERLEKELSIIFKKP